MDVINLCFSHFNGKYSRVARRYFSTNSNWLSKGHEWAERYADQHVLPTRLHFFAHSSKAFYVFLAKHVLSCGRYKIHNICSNAHASCACSQTEKRPIGEEWAGKKTSTICVSKPYPNKSIWSFCCFTVYAPSCAEKTILFSRCLQSERSTQCSHFIFWFFLLFRLSNSQ